MGNSRTHDDLLEAFQQEGCPVCRLALAGVRLWMDSVAYESVNDPGTREKLRESHGFCNTHAYAWTGQRTLLGTSIIYNDVLSNLRDDLSGLKFEKQSLLSEVASVLGGSGRLDQGESHRTPRRAEGMCPACTVQLEHECRTVDSFVRGMDEQPFRQAYAGSSGLCLLHFQAALESMQDDPTFDALKEDALSRLDTLTGQLREIIRRHDYRFTAEPEGEERGAADRAVRQMVGETGIRGVDLDGGRS